MLALLTVVSKVRPPPPKTIVIKKTCVEILDQWEKSIDETGITEADVRRQFPSLPQPLSRINKVTLSVHCECALLTRIINRFLKSGIPIHVEIGVSKSLCAHCETYLGLVEQRYKGITIKTTSRHGKYVAGWRIPPSIPPELVADMESAARTAVNEICGKVNRFRRSYSEPRGGYAITEYTDAIAKWCAWRG